MISDFRLSEFILIVFCVRTNLVSSVFATARHDAFDVVRPEPIRAETLY